jgi:dipeptidase E
MKKIILTSAGFENKVIEQKFLEMVGKEVNEIKAIWIPTAAIDEDAKAVLPKCMDDLLNAGIKEENIKVYDLDYVISDDELSQYDVIYVCGGNCRYLLDKINEVQFTDKLNRYVNGMGVYVGVSAGSCICSADFPDEPNWISCRLDVHCKEGTIHGEVDVSKIESIRLTDNQAAIFEGNKIFIIE